MPGRDGGTIKNSILITEEVQRGKASNLQEVLRALDGPGGGLPPAGAEISPLWRLLAEHFLAFLAEYDDRFLREYGFLRSVIPDGSLPPMR